MIVGELEAAARDEATTLAAGESCGPPDVGVAPAVEAPDVACRLTVFDEAATDDALPAVAFEAAAETLLAVVAKFGVAEVVLRAVVADAAVEVTVGVALAARCGPVAEPDIEAVLDDVLRAEIFPSVAATCALVTA